MSVDAERVSSCIWCINDCWSIPLMFLATMFSLWQTLGYSAFIGLLVLVFFSVYKKKGNVIWIWSVSYCLFYGIFKYPNNITIDQNDEKKKWKIKTIPLMFLATMFSLWQTLGYSAFIGLLVLVFVIPFNSLLVKKGKDLHVSFIHSRQKH
jgi:hypothetical protein